MIFLLWLKTSQLQIHLRGLAFFKSIAGTGILWVGFSFICLLLYYLYLIYVQTFFFFETLKLLNFVLVAAVWNLLLTQLNQGSASLCLLSAYLLNCVGVFYTYWLYFMAQYKYVTAGSKYFHFMGFCLFFVFLWKFVFFLVAAYTELVGENFQENPLIHPFAQKTFYFYEYWLRTPSMNYFNLFLARANR
jgi:hypothetical protein